MKKIARTPWFPTYQRARQMMTAMDGVAASDFRSMDEAIGKQMGTPQSQVSWSDPDEWIDARLQGKDRDLARQLWDGPKLNPRYSGGEMALARNYGLLETDTAGVYRLTARGQAFIAQQPAIIREIDEAEGITQLLSVLATIGTAQRKDIVVPWMEALAPGGDGRSQGTMESKLYDRLVNVVERGLVERDGHKYVLTSQGRKYATSVEVQQKNSAKLTLDSALATYRAEQRSRLRDLLRTMHPYRFEHLIRTLLMAMGYENVEVTKQSGDGGIDVLADLRFGVTSFREAIQVKRVQQNIQPGTVNELRGSLHNAKALKGTIFTVASFSKKAREAAAPDNTVPITLVDGDELIDLLIKHHIGVTVTRVELVTDINDQLFSSEPMTAQEKQDADA
ncbi:restriction endonuclease [Deinococcus arcticus]|uniref:Restriction endonuclease n=1 Tax=Deinococcus arcticus TaxID=2136176 RepID=A0A2T3W6F2_9DEIO|nr:restriction endonuclease [Deinococcus arcticus]PTA67333.1 restriction endonuclease [Deinococcus arcticus]